MHEDIKNALEILKKGGVIIYPTEIYWSLGCDATNAEAVKKIFEIKQSPDFKEITLLLDNPAYLSFYVQEIPEIANDLIDLSDKPLTLIFSQVKNIAPHIAETGSTGFRIVGDDFCKSLISRLRKPLLSIPASANSKTPFNFDEIEESIISAVDYVVKYKQDDYSKALPLSIIKLGSKGEIEIIRK